jgi:serine/threonine-protein kinase
MAENDGPTLFQPGEPFRHYPYVIVRFIGAGAHGQVYEVVHRHTGDHRVLKAVQAVGSGSDKTIAQRLAEATAVYRIHHHNIVQVFELALEPDRLVWQIMELLDGCSIEELLARHARFTPLFAIDVAVEIAFGLHEVHEHQIIHRDIHPGNVFVTKNGTV